MVALKFVIICLSLTSLSKAFMIEEGNSTRCLENENSKILSRRKRFLVFPDGSSFQLVFCTQNHGYLRIGNIVWFGNTAALAWELPSDPAIFSMFKDKKLLHESTRRQDVSKHNIYYLNEAGRVIAKVPYKRRPIINPAFAKRSIDSDTVKEKAARKAQFISQMHIKHKNKNILKNLDPKTIDFHKDSRKSLYEKVEKLIKGLGWHGKDCLRRVLCDFRQEKNEQGTFIEEILTAAFTLPGNTEADKYDVTPGSSEHCAAMYSDCRSDRVQ